MQRKSVLQMSGAPGSGKTTLANQLAKAIGGVLINHDLIRSFFLENEMSSDQSAKLTYGLQWKLAEDTVKQGLSVVIDSTCNHKETLEQGVAVAERYGYEYRYIECQVDDIELLDERLHSRVAMRSQRSGVESPPPDAIDTEGKDNQRDKFKAVCIQFPQFSLYPQEKHSANF